jgi:transcriptional regulator with XRE-family HTH domain
MTPIKQGKYEFKKNNLVAVRKQMGLSQSKTAELLGIPANTLSRWEIGATVPDAMHLAAFYSLAKEHGITPAFFEIRGNTKPYQYNLIVLWDFQTTGIPLNWIQYTHNTMMAELQKRFGGMTPMYKAFFHPTQTREAAELEKLGWRIQVGERDVYDDIIRQARSDSDYPSNGTVLVLISLDDGFADLIEELTSKDIPVYVMSTQVLNNKLVEKAGQERHIPWYPVALEQPRRELKGVS